MRNLIPRWIAKIRPLQAIALALAAPVLGPDLWAADSAAPLPLLTNVGTYHLLSDRQGAAAIAYDGSIYILGGNARGAVTDIERFNVTTHQSDRIGNELLSRRYFSAIEYQGSVYLFGGEGRGLPGQEFESVVEIFDLRTNKISRGPSMPVPRAHMGAVRLGTKVYLCGGAKRNAYSIVQTNETDVYDLATQAWSKGAYMPIARQTSAIAIDPFIVAIGGYHGPRGTPDVSLFDARAGRWTILPALSRPVSAHSTALLGRTVFVFGDYDDLDTVLAYDLTTRATRKMAVDFHGARHSAAVAYENKIYVIGGNTDSSAGESNLLQVFAPATVPQ